MGARKSTGLERERLRFGNCDIPWKKRVGGTA
jgi:hypothetical protein